MRYLGKMKNQIVTGLFAFAAAVLMLAVNVMEVQA